MLIYLHGSQDKHPPADHYLIVSPAAHLRGEEVPAAWVDERNNPLQFEVHFKHGRAEVDDEIGNYLVKTGQAQKSRLIVPTPWN